MKTGKSYIIAGLFEGRPFNSPNDITIDEKGRIYFSDPRYLGPRADRPAGAGGLSHRPRRLDPPHHHRRRQAQRRLRLARSEDALRRQQRQRGNRLRTAKQGWRGASRQGRHSVAQGPHGPAGLRPGADGTAKFRKMLVDYRPQDGPDGLVCDKEGNSTSPSAPKPGRASVSIRPKARSWPTSRPRSRPTSASAAARRAKRCTSRPARSVSHPAEQGRISAACQTLIGARGAARVSLASCR